MKHKLKRFLKKEGKGISILLYVIDLSATRVDETVYKTYLELGKGKLFFVILNKSDKIGPKKKRKYSKYNIKFPIDPKLKKKTKINQLQKKIFLYLVVFVDVKKTKN